MDIAIMQPYLFPYLGYFSLIKNTDYFIFFDTPQYIKKGWINRNRILGCGGKDIYFTVPVEKAPRETSIKEIKIDKSFDWRQKWLGQMSIYKRRAPHYKDVMELLNNVLNYDYEYISELGIKSVLETCKYLDISIKYDIFSKMDIPNLNVNAADEWALFITKYMGYDTYINPPGGKSFFCKEKYLKNNINLKFLTQELMCYDQRTPEFIPGLSIIDIMMFCSPDEIMNMLGKYTID